MEITGYIKEILEARGGISGRTGNPWKVQSYVLETVEQYPKHVSFDVKNDNIEAFNIKQGEEMTVFFDIDANEYNGKWYNKVTAWKVEKTGNVIYVTRTSSNANGNNNTAQPQQPSLYAQAQAAAAAAQAQQASHPAMQNLQNTFNAEPAAEGNGLPF